MRIQPSIHLFILIISLIAITPIKAEEKPSREAARLNFVFVLVDDLAWNNLGCFGSPFYESPNLDAFSRSAMRFTQAYAAHPVCSPTRAAIMSGKNPARLKITDWIPGVRPKNKKLLGPEILHQLPLSEVTIAEALKAGGYKTFFAGKWHLGGEGYLPADQGFEVNVGGNHTGGPAGGYYAPFKNKQLPKVPDGTYLTDMLTDQAISFIEANKANPFFVYLSFYNVHTPIQACKRHLDYFKNKTGIPKVKTGRERKGSVRLSQDNLSLATMIYAMDENFGRLWKRLGAMGLASNTVVIFTSDNGGLSIKKKAGPNTVYPLRGSKGWCYEGGIRIPTMIYVPGLTKGGSSDVLTVSMDFYPTMLELAGLPQRPQQHMDGKSMVPLINGKERLDREDIVFHYPHYHGSTWTPGSAIRQGDWKLIEFYDEQKIELYNLKEDAGERNDLAGGMPEKVAALRKRLHERLKAQSAAMPKMNPGYRK